MWIFLEVPRRGEVKYNTCYTCVQTFISTSTVYTLSQKKRTNFETVWLEIVRIDFDDIWQKYSK